MSARPWRRGLLWLALLAPLFYASYGLANHLASLREAVPSVVADWERHVPFWAWTIVPYWSLNLFYGASLLLAPDRHVLDRHAARLLTAQAVAVTCFILWPLRFSGPQPAVDGVLGGLFEALRGFDQPYNQAPSLHVALTVVMWDFYRRLLASRVARVLLGAWMLAIAGSVLTTWQHHAIDVPTGALLGLLCLWLWPLERRVSLLRAWRPAADPARRRLAWRYGAGAAVLAVAATLSGPLGALALLWGGVALAAVALCYAGLGARGFGRDRHGRMDPAARVLMAPYLAAARLNAWLWTRRAPVACEVAPGVLLGSVVRPAVASPEAAWFSLCAELPPPRGAGSRCLPWLDLVPASPAALRRAAAGIEASRLQGRPVVVACALGFSRSVAVLACWLARSGRAADLDDALAQLRRLRPQLVLGPDWRAALQAALR